MTDLTEQGGAVGGRRLAGLLNRGRLLVMAVAFFVELGLFAAGLLLPVDPGTQSSLLNQTSTEFVPIQSGPPSQAVFLIFSHNVVIALVEIVPVVGAFLLANSLYATGVVTQVLLSSNGAPGFFGFSLLLFPYSLVELSAYAVAFGSGVMLVVAWSKGRLREEAFVLLEEMVLVVGLLLVAAAMEEVTSLSQFLGTVLWIPTGLGIAAMFAIAKRVTT